MCKLKVLIFMSMITLINGICLYDLKSALATAQRIWTRYRSYDRCTGGQSHKCIYNVVSNQGYNHYLITQSYKVSGTWRRQQFYGGIYETKSGPKMQLSPRRGEPGVEYTLVFWDNIEHCAVFTLKTKCALECEMHVWNDHVEKHVPKCQLAYKHHCTGQQYGPYSKQCYF
uniref:Lipocalin n=1 Tax=Rhipicephalus appendiculatus TaxID=34631 RepID=A0A131Z4A7_RHIAP